MLLKAKPVEAVSFSAAYSLQLITKWISDSNEVIVTAPASAEEKQCKLEFLKSDSGEKQFVYQFCCVTAFSSFQ
jgi:hypothetical protein